MMPPMLCAAVACSLQHVYVYVRVPLVLLRRWRDIPFLLSTPRCVLLPLVLLLLLLLLLLLMYDWCATTSTARQLLQQRVVLWLDTSGRCWDRELLLLL